MSALVTEHLPLLAGAPDGIKKLRELILELAVRGRLVLQDADDEPAGKLLDRIAASRGGQVAQGKFSKQKQSVLISEEERPFELAKGWEWSRLSDLVNVLNGRAYSKEELINSGTPVLRVGNLFTSKHWYYSDLNLEEDKYCNPGDLLFAWSASFGPFIWSGERVIYHYHIWKLKFFDDSSLDKRYLYNFLLERTQEIKASGHGVSMVHMTKEKMEKLIVPVPPLKEQCRIVAKIDELMALCDRLEARQADAESAHAQLVEALLGSLTQARDANDFATSWQRLSQHFHTLFTTESSIDALKQAVLQLAVMGKLVPQRLDSQWVPTKVPVARESAGPYLLPTGWIWVRLSDIEPDFQNGASSRGDSEGESVTVLRLADIKAGEVCLEDTRDLTLSSATVSKHALEDGDVLVIRVNGSADLVGRFVVFRIASQVIPCDHFIRMRILQSVVVPEYLKLVGDSELTRTAIAGLFVSTAGQKTVNQGHIGSLLLPLPPQAEQHRIVVKVDQLMSLCDQLKSRLTQARQLNQKLASTLVEQAVA